MPSLCKRSCSTPGCRHLVSQGSKCSSCLREYRARQDSNRGGRTQRGYGSSHQTLRKMAFVRDEWKCVDCGWQPAVVVEFNLHALGEPEVDAILNELRIAKNRNERHLHADHDIPIDERPDLANDLDNYKTRCNTCHSAKTMRELRETSGHERSDDSDSGPRVR